MKHTQRYFEAVAAYRKAMKDLQESYDKSLQILESHRGSEYFRNEKKRLDDKYSQDRAALQAESRRILNGIINDMETVHSSKPAVAPTAEQLATVQMLNMRSSVTRDELRQAANTCKGCPMAIETLREIATKSGIMGGVDFLYSNNGASPNFGTLRKQTSLLVDLNRVSNRSEWVNHREYDKFFVDFDPADPADCMRVMACATDFNAFSAAVDE